MRLSEREHVVEFFDRMIRHETGLRVQRWVRFALDPRTTSAFEEIADLQLDWLSNRERLEARLQAVAPSY